MIVLEGFVVGALLVLVLAATGVHRPRARLEDLLAAALDDAGAAPWEDSEGQRLLDGRHPAASHLDLAPARRAPAAGRDGRRDVSGAQGEGGRSTVIAFPAAAERARRRTRRAHPAGAERRRVPAAVAAPRPTSRAHP